MTDNQPGRPGTLDDQSQGVWVVDTESSRYLLDLDSRTIVRSPKITQPETDLVPPVAALRLDHDTIALITLIRCRVGGPMILILDVRKDGIRTKRQTTNVTSIQPLSDVIRAAGFDPSEGPLAPDWAPTDERS